MATATIDYDAFSGFVTKTTDANGNVHRYYPTDYDGTGAASLETVTVEDAQGNVVRRRTVGYDANMSQTLLRDAGGRTFWTKSYGSGARRTTRRA